MPCMNLYYNTSFNVIRRVLGVPRYQLGSLNGHLGDRRVTLLVMVPLATPTSLEVRS